ncbi:hypothetical protein [Micromonospora sp. NPDC023633]|uniref:hypothetical protein n=1 Tax=Micromonospora sp. NPDC023633 TaxID=3154320 RepID=UPI0033F2B562
MTTTAMEAPPVTAAPTDTGVCGTLRGYHRHRNANQRPCQPCRDEYSQTRAAAAGWVARTEAAARPLPPKLGALAGTDVGHEFAPTAPTMGLPQCRWCFGWSDDVRHLAAGR